MNYFAELKRRNVFRVAIAYLALAWVMLQVADVIVPGLGLPTSIITLMIVVGIIGFPFALFFAWAYELTPEGVKATKDVDVEDSIRSTTGQKINYIIIGLLSVAVIFLLFDRNSNSTNTEEDVISETPALSTERENTIAVMPFADMSPDGSQEYFGDGIAEEILKVLVSVDDLKVTSRTSSFAYKGTNAQIPQIAAELNVNYVLEGSIRTAGDNVRVSAQLIDVAADQHLWSDTFDRDLSDIFAIQDEISLAISDALQVELLGDQIGDIPTGNMEAYDLYLQIRQLGYVPSSESTARALELAKRVVELDPQFSEGWSELARSYIYYGNWNSVDAEEEKNVIELAIGAANKAVALNPSDATAWMSIAQTMIDGLNWKEALQAHERATAIAPKDYRVWFSLGYYYTLLGWFDDADRALAKAVEIDPADAVTYSVLGRSYISNKKLELGRQTIQQSIDMGYGPALVNMAILNLMENDSDAAKRNFTVQETQGAPLSRGALPADEGGYYSRMVDGYFNPELRDDYINIVPEVEPLSLVTASMLLQNADHLASWLEVEGRGTTNLRTYIMAPPFRGMINQPSLKEHFYAVGLPQFWRETKWPKFCRPVGEDDFECQDGEGNWP